MPKSKYETHVKPRLSEIKNWRRDGAEHEWIAKKLGVAAGTFYKYKANYAELREALKDAEMSFYQDLVLTAEDSLLKKLKDRYDITEELIEQWVDKDGKVIKQHKIIKKRLIPADTTAIIFALKAHKGNVWNTEEKQMNEAKVEKIKLESKNIEQHKDLASVIGDKLSGYLEDKENIKK